MILIFGLLTTSCEKKEVKIKSFPKKWHYGKPPVVVFENLQEAGIKTIRFRIDQDIRGGAKVLDTIVLPAISDMKLGKHEITFFFENQKGEVQSIRKNFTLYASESPEKWDYEIVAEYPHDMKAFTQGLEFEEDTLYESTGQYGESTLRKVDFKTGKLFQKIDFDSRIFAEGLTVWGDSVLVLTWQNKKGFVFNRKFEKIGEFPYEKSKEGWGLCHNDQWIFKSDGTEKIWILDPKTLEEVDFINVYTYSHKIRKINELEWVEGKIFTNIWQKNGIAVINPRTGEVVAVLDMSGLLKKVKKHPDLDVLNGIAYHPKRGTIFVTGKNWDKLFEIKIKKN